MPVLRTSNRSVLPAITYNSGLARDYWETSCNTNKGLFGRILLGMFSCVSDVFRKVLSIVGWFRLFQTGIGLVLF